MSPGMRVPRAPRSLTGQLVALLAVALTIVIAASTLLIVTMVQSNDAGAQARLLSRARADAATTVAALLAQQNAVLAYVVTSDPAERAAFDAATTTFDTGAAALRTGLRQLGQPADRIDAFIAAHAVWQVSVATPVADLVSSGLVDTARVVAAGPTASTSQADLKVVARGLWDQLDAEYKQALATAVDLKGRLTGLIIGVLGVFLVTLVAATVLVRYAAVRPVLQLQTTARRVADGAWDDVVTVRGPAEITALAGDVDLMRVSLLDALDNERRAAEALDQQGPAVLALRDALAPAPWTQPGFESSGRLDPVEGLLAGDWYDIVALGEHRVGVILGDVAGHGAASGVYALRLKGLLRQALLSGMTPSTALASVAAHIAQFPDNVRVASGELFATVFLAVADREVGELVYASAGHLDAVVMRAVVPVAGDPPAGEPTVADVSRWDHVDLPPTGPMLSALLADRIWTERRHRFSPDDLLVTATDGVIEARDPVDDDEYGTVRIVDRLGSRLTVGDSLSDAVDAVFADLAGFERRARDDRTMVALRQSSVRRRFDATRVGAARPVRPS